MAANVEGCRADELSLPEATLQAVVVDLEDVCLVISGQQTSTLSLLPGSIARTPYRQAGNLFLPMFSSRLSNL